MKLVCLDTKCKPDELHVFLQNMNVERSILQIYCGKPANVRMGWGDICGDTEKGYTQANWRLVVVHTLRYLLKAMSR